MTNRLGFLLSDDDLPATELRCACIDGELVAVGDGWSPLDEPVGARHRATAAALLVPGRAIAERMTAAWIFGVAPEPRQHQFCVDAAFRTHVPPSSRIRLREVSCPDADTLRVGDVRVTTPLRTALDLARHGGTDEPALARAIAGVLEYGGITPEALAFRLDSYANAPHTRLARRRINEAAARASAPSSRR